MYVNDWKVGADPEFALHNGKEFISAEGIVGGSKKNPLSIGNGCYVQEDCVGVEFNIPPASCVDEFHDSIIYALSVLRERIPVSLKFSWVPSAEFSPVFLSTKQASMSGCEKDLSVYGERYKIPKLKNTQTRAFGAHLHYGYSNPNDYLSQAIVMFNDVYVNIPTLHYEDEASSVERRKLYGRAGTYRIKPYGVEYRSLSSWWLQSSEKIRLIFGLASYAINMLNTMGKELLDMMHTKTDMNAIMMAINSHDKMSAKYIMDKYQTPIV